MLYFIYIFIHIAICVMCAANIGLFCRVHINALPFLLHDEVSNRRQVGRVSFMNNALSLLPMMLTTLYSSHLAFKLPLPHDMPSH